MKEEGTSLLKESRPDSLVTSIRQIFVHVTRSCNLNCAYCYSAAHSPMRDELTLAELSATWHQMVALRPRKVIFTGGEPLLRTDIFQLFCGLRDADPSHSVVRCLNTNGHKVSPELARALVGLIDEVSVSLDALPDRNDKLRGAGNFDAALRAIDTLYSVGFQPKVIITFTSVSEPDLEELLCFLLGRGITRIKVNEFRPVGRGTGHQEWHADIQEARRAVQRARWRFGLDSPEPISASVGSRHNCGIGHFLNIMPNGDVYPCHVLTQPEFQCGSIREQSLLDICKSDGLLGRLAAIDVREWADSNPEFANSLESDACIGTVYSTLLSSPDQRRHNAPPGVVGSLGTTSRPTDTFRFDQQTE